MAEYPLGKVSISNKGAYSPTTTYTPLDAVTHNGGSFLCKATVTGVEPGAGANWQNYWTNLTRGVSSIAITSPSAGTANVQVTLSDGTQVSFSFSTSAIAAGSVGTTELADDSVTDAKLDLSGGFTVDGDMILTNGIGFGDSLPGSGTEGQIFFLRVQ